MRVAINAVRVSRQGGGGTDHYITHLVKYLAREGKDFDLFTLVPEQFPDVPAGRIKIPFPFSLMVSKPASGKPVSGNIGAQSSSTGGKSLRQYFGRIVGDTIKMLWTQFVFPFRLITGGYDLVFSPSQIDALPFPPIKQVMTVLDVIPFVLKLPMVKHEFFLRNFFPMALRRSVKIVAISEHTKKDLVKLFGISESKIAAIPLAQPELGESNGPAPEAIRQKYKLGRYVLCVSGNHAHKNLPRLLEAFKIVAEKTEWQLAIAGYQDADQQVKLDNWVKQNNMLSRILFLGHTPSADLPPLYQGAELFVFPSLYEGFGLPPLEALSYGVPVASSNSSSLTEVVGCAGVYFDPESVKEMADQMLRVLNDNDLRNQLRSKGIEHAKTFSWARTARATWAAFENALGK